MPSPSESSFHEARPRPPWTAEGLAAYTESLYLSEEELLDHLTLALEAVYPLAAEE